MEKQVTLDYLKEICKKHMIKNGGRTKRQHLEALAKQGVVVVPMNRATKRSVSRTSSTEPKTKRVSAPKKLTQLIDKQKLGLNEVTDLYCRTSQAGNKVIEDTNLVVNSNGIVIGVEENGQVLINLSTDEINYCIGQRISFNDLCLV